MTQSTPLVGHVSFPAWTARSTMQVRSGNDVVAEPSPALKYLELMNPLRWSTNDLSRFAAFARFLLVLVDRFIDRS